MARKPQITTNPESREEQSELPSTMLRLLDVRRTLRKRELWKTFEIKRTFDAFSIHKLAREVEDVLNDHGLISTFEVKKWTKGGNITIVEGVYSISCADGSDDPFQIEAIGEGADNGDKGINKAISSARKNAMICALNLGIGIDVEEEDVQAATEVREAAQAATQPPSQQGPHPQAWQAPPPGTYVQAPPPGSYTLRFTDGPELVAMGDVFNRISAHVNLIRSPAQVDAWVAANEAALSQIWNDNNAIGFGVRRLIETHRQGLVDAIKAA